MDRTRKIVAWAVVGHVLLTVAHGVVHAAIPVLPSGWKAGYVGIVMYGLPLVGGAAVLRGDGRAGAHRGYARVGALCLLGAGVGGLAFEGVFHFLVANPDHVAHVTQHGMAFTLTALLSTASNLLLLGAGWISVRAGRRKTAPPIDGSTTGD